MVQRKKSLLALLQSDRIPQEMTLYCSYIVFTEYFDQIVSKEMQLQGP